MTFNRPFGLTDTNYRIDQNTFSDEAFRGEYSGDNLIYKGFGRPGSNENDPVWQIAFLSYDGDGNVLSIEWPLEVIYNSTSIPQTESFGNVTTPWTSFSGTISNLPLVKGSVVITVGTITFKDTLKDGTLTGNPGTNSGTINYDTGAFALTINPALMMDTAVTGVYSTYPLGGASNDNTFVWSERHSYTYE
jgi:hypothetical protein